MAVADSMLVVAIDDSVGALGLPAYGPIDEPREPTSVQVVNVPDGVKRTKIYIHGDAERAAGFDIPLFRSGTVDLAQDVQPCQLVTRNGDMLACALYLWRAADEQLMCGFVIADNDEESAAYARECRAEKRRNI